MTCTVEEGLTNRPPSPRRSTRRRYLLELEAQGWRLGDHAAMKTKKRVGHWGPTLLDVAILSLGKLFVGDYRPLDVGFDSRRLAFD